MTREEAIRRIKAWNLDSDDREVLAVVIPELAESEDERIRTELLSSFKGIMADADEDELWYGLPYNDIIAWLEKQKSSFRQIHDGIIWHNGLRTGIELEKRQGRNPADLSEMMVHKEPYIAPVPTPMVADEQKPVDYDAELEKCKHNFIYFWDKYATVKLKTAKWSGKDEKMLQSIIEDFRDGNISSIGQEQWLKSLPERFNLQPKQEWSEEDENCIRNLESVIYYDKNLPTDTRIKLGDFLKSLRSQSHWKPSEEQMKALTNFIVGDEYDAHALAHLWAELKELSSKD